MPKLGLIGTGNMAGAMLQAALNAGFLQPEDLLLYDKNPQTAAQFGLPVAQSAAEVAAQCEIIQIGVKPQDQPALLATLDLSDKLVVSIAAGVRLKALDVPRAVRLMPNMNAAIGQSMTAFCATEQVSEQALRFIENYCQCFGQIISLEEAQFSVFTAVAGSGPAFVYAFIHALAQAGGLSLEVAVQTVLGSAMMLKQSGAQPDELIQHVCSPGGTTIAGMNALQKNNFEYAVQQAVQAAAARERELGILDNRQ